MAVDFETYNWRQFINFGKNAAQFVQAERYYCNVIDIHKQTDAWEFICKGGVRGRGGIPL